MDLLAVMSSLRLLAIALTLISLASSSALVSHLTPSLHPAKRGPVIPMTRNRRVTLLILGGRKVWYVVATTSPRLLAILKARSILVLLGSNPCSNSARVIRKEWAFTVLPTEPWLHIHPSGHYMENSCMSEDSATSIAGVKISQTSRIWILQEPLLGQYRKARDAALRPTLMALSLPMNAPNQLETLCGPTISAVAPFSMGIPQTQTVPARREQMQ